VKRHTDYYCDLAACEECDAYAARLHTTPPVTPTKSATKSAKEKSSDTAD
jgi:hypothetical protein